MMRHAVLPRYALTKRRYLKRNKIAKLDANDRVEFLDINKVFLDDDGTLPKSVMPDLLHPPEHGYKLWADAIEEPIARVLGEK